MIWNSAPVPSTSSEWERRLYWNDGITFVHSFTVAVSVVSRCTLCCAMYKIILYNTIRP